MNDKVRFRMCVGCRNKMHQSKMLRICHVNNEIKIDFYNNLGGRGAYICSKDCLLRINQKNALNRVLKTHVPLEFLETLEERLNNAE